MLYIQTVLIVTTFMSIFRAGYYAGAGDTEKVIVNIANCITFGIAVYLSFHLN